jgi:hypothetical protein
MPNLAYNWFGISTRSQHYYQIVSGNGLKSDDIAKEFTQFEPNIDPIPSDGKVDIGYPRTSVPKANFTIKMYWHQVPNAILTIKLYR